MSEREARLELVREARRLHGKWLERFEGQYEVQDNRIILADSWAQSVYGAGSLNTVPALCDALEASQREIVRKDRKIASLERERERLWKLINAAERRE